jgi:tetratricopeptide (TPR) repeat protein
VEWVDVKGKSGSLAALGGRLKMRAGARSALALIALAALCSCTLAQETTAEDWIERGEELLYSGSLEESVEAFNKAIDLDPQNADVWRYKALILRDQGEYDEAIAAFDRAIEFDPQNTEAKVEKAGTLMVMGRQGEALAIFDELTAEVPDDPEERLRQSSAWRSKGNVFAEQGLWNESLVAYSRAIELGYGDPLATYAASSNRGRVLNKLGRYEEAVEACNMALEAYNDTSGLTATVLMEMMGEPRLWKAEALEALGNGDEAFEAYERAAEAFEPETSAYPEIAKFWLFLARAQEGMGRHEEAAASYERAVEAFEDEIKTHAESSNVWRYQWMGEALEALGHDSEAGAAYARARELGYRG